MTELTNSEFIQLIKDKRSTESFLDFCNILRELNHFDKIVEIVAMKNDQWAELVGINSKSEPPPEASPLEMEWTKYFNSHSFPGAEDRRNLVDAISLLTGLDLSRHIKIIRKGKDRFNSYIALVPIRSGRDTNDHSYSIGEPILSLGSGTVFYKTDGEPGNSMDITTSSYRMATLDEIEEIVSYLLYRLAPFAEHIVLDLFGGF